MPTASTRETLLRQWRLLALLPRAPRALTVAALRAGLTTDGFVVTRRTIERDLQKLSSAGFPLSCQTTNGLQHWALIDTREPWLPNMPSVSDAILLLLARDYLTPLLPPLMQRALDPTFAQAESVLTIARATSHLARWRDKVRATLPTQTLIAPAVSRAVHEACAEALMQERQLSVSYASRSRDTRQTLVLNPLALLQRGLISYLVATASPHTDPRLYALHRVRSARVLDAGMTPVPGFDLQTFLAKGFGDFGHGERIQVRLRVSPSVATHLAECRLSDDQTITPVRTPAGWSRVTASVNDTPQLRWWIRAFGPDIRAERPRLK